MRNVCIKAVHIAMVHTNYVEKEVLAGRGASLILSLSLSCSAAVYVSDISSWSLSTTSTLEWKWRRRCSRSNNCRKMWEGRIEKNFLKYRDESYIWVYERDMSTRM